MKQKKKKKLSSMKVQSSVGRRFCIVRRATPAALSFTAPSHTHDNKNTPENRPGPDEGCYIYIYSVCLIVVAAISTVTSQENKSERRRR